MLIFMHCSYLTIAQLSHLLQVVSLQFMRCLYFQGYLYFASKLCCALLCSFPKVNGWYCWSDGLSYLYRSSNVVELAPLLATTVETHYQYFSVLLEKHCLCILGQFNTETFYLIKDCLLLLKWIIQSFSCILGQGWSLMYWQWREIIIMPWKIIENKRGLFQLWQSIWGVKNFLFSLPHLSPPNYFVANYDSMSASSPRGVKINRTLPQTPKPSAFGEIACAR